MGFISSSFRVLFRLFRGSRRLSFSASRRLEQMGFARARGASQMEVWADLALGLYKHLQGLVDLGSNLLLLREYELHDVSR